jgi:hypothetical protein
MIIQRLVNCLLGFGEGCVGLGMCRYLKRRKEG